MKNLKQSFFAISMCITSTIYSAQEPTAPITPKTPKYNTNPNFNALTYAALEKRVNIFEKIQNLTPENVNKPGNFGQFDYALEFIVWQYQQSLRFEAQGEPHYASSQESYNALHKLLDIGAQSKHCKEIIIEIANSVDDNKLFEKISRNN